MGRGSSGRVATRSASRASTTPRAQQRMTPQELYNFFETADNTQANQMLESWRQERMDSDNRSNDNDIQRFFHAIGWTENLPVALGEGSYQAAWRAAGQPKQIYHSDYDAANGTAGDFADQYMGLGFDSNGNRYRQYIANGIYGGGTYYASSASESASYGTNQFRGYLNSKAKVADWTSIRRQYNQFVNSHPGFKRMVNNMTAGYGGDKEKVSIFAAMKGYNVIHDRYSDYYVVLDRSATTVSLKTKPADSRMTNW